MSAIVSRVYAFRDTDASEPVYLEIQVDIVRLARTMFVQARRSKTGKATGRHGAIKAKIVRKARP